MSQTCAFCLASMSPGRNNSLTSSLHVIERYALNSKGIVGTLYDARTDNILSNLPVNQDLIIKNDVKESPTCQLIKAGNSFSENLLKMIDIEDELRVSVILGMTPVTEGTLLLDTYGLSGVHKMRFIFYNHIAQQECLSTDTQTARNTLPKSLPNNSATHIITSLQRGIDFVIALELPENENHNEIDCVLDKLCSYFTKPEQGFLSPEEQQKINGLKPIIFTQITEIRSLTNTKNLSDICQDIHRFIFGYKDNVPLSYTLHAVKCIYNNDSSNERVSDRLDKWILSKVEEKIVPLHNKFKSIKHLFHDKVLPHLSQYLKTSIDETHEKVSRIKNMYEEIQQPLATAINELRRGNLRLLLPENELNSEQLKAFDSELETLHATLVKLHNKASFIAKLKTYHHMDYLNVADLEDSDDDQETLEGKLFSLDQELYRCYLCSSDELIKNDSNEHEKLCQHLIELRQTNSSLCFVFADFSYCAFKLNAMKIFQPPIPLLSVPSVIEPNEMNILLIGETGVGKSTFINAFVNYLAFQSLEDAKNGEPIVLIPVSFIITIGDEFQEKTINFGQPDSNEDHIHSGQSVTQHCKSYIFNIGNNIKIRIIDTPGVGDTRGVEQDNKNIEHILSYINNLSHLNAICFLLKPNTTRLHALFRSCFIQLFHFLGPSARENIIFCFTNTRATFYTPGNTAPLLRKMLQELPNGDTFRFAKENTFCFDSESFRYLVVIKATNEMPFDENQQIDFDKSWRISVAESTRLLNFIQSRPKYQMNKWHSIKHAQMMITLLVRPILETIRNALRNLVLQDSGDKQCVIEMQARPISEPASLCATCQCKTPTKIGNIWIATNSIHLYRTLNVCDTCSCTFDQHFPIFYTLEYRSSGTKGVRFHSEIENMKDRLFNGSLLFTQFLLHTTNISQIPFLPWLNLFIQEEENLYSKQSSSSFHIKLCNNLHTVKSKYETCLKEMKSDQERISLDTIYVCIEEVLKYPMIAEQMEAIKTSQMKILKDHERDVSSQYPHMSMNGFLRHPTMINQ